jgi:CHAD domain-containing protein
MAEVLRQHAQARREARPEVVHDLRVALRRCLSISGTLSRLDASAPWPAMHRSGRRLFRSLGRLRDLQVQAAWVRHFDPEQEAWPRLGRALAREEEAAREAAQAAIRRFRRRRWERWSLLLPPRLDRLDAENGFLLRLAIVQLGRAQALHRLPLGRDRAYHQLRLELKRFRYFLEAFLPAQHGDFIDELRAVQDLLGDAHDLDALEDRLVELGGGAAGRRARRGPLLIAAARQERFAAYAALSEAPESPLWPRWRRRLLRQLEDERPASGGALRRTASSGD